MTNKGTRFQNGVLRTDYVVLTATLICKGYKMLRAELNAENHAEFVFTDTPVLRSDVGTFFRYDIELPVRKLSRSITQIKTIQRDLKASASQEITAADR